jgi:AcrR family transcriptional regulator
MKTAATDETPPARRATLTRDQVLEAAVRLADRDGIESVSMRRLGQELGIEAMSLYTHVRNKEDLLDGMVEVVVRQIPARPKRSGWGPALRQTILSARSVMLRHPWASRVIETRNEPGPAGLRHFDTVMGILRDGGFSLALTHHALHLLGSRILGFSQDLFDDSPDVGPEAAAMLAAQLATTHPYVAEMALGVTHEGGLGGCDDDVEFEFALDAILDILERRRDDASAA